MIIFSLIHTRIRKILTHSMILRMLNGLFLSLTFQTHANIQRQNNRVNLTIVARQRNTFSSFFDKFFFLLYSIYKKKEVFIVISKSGRAAQVKHRIL